MPGTASPEGTFRRSWESERPSEDWGWKARTAFARISRSRWVWVLRYFVGYGRMLAQEDHNCRYLGQPADPCAISGDSWFSANIPYLGVSLGHTF